MSRLILNFRDLKMLFLFCSISFRLCLKELSLWATPINSGFSLSFMTDAKIYEDIIILLIALTILIIVRFIRWSFNFSFLYYLKNYPLYLLYLKALQTFVIFCNNNHESNNIRSIDTPYQCCSFSKVAWLRHTQTQLVERKN